MQVFMFHGQKTMIPENALDVVKILLLEKGVDSINYSDQATLEGLISLVPYSRQSGRGYGHITISKKEFTWLQRAVADQVSRPINFVCLSPASA